MFALFQVKWVLTIKASWMSTTFNGIQIKFHCQRRKVFKYFKNALNEVGDEESQRLTCFNSWNTSNLYKREDHCIISKFKILKKGIGLHNRVTTFLLRFSEQIQIVKYCCVSWERRIPSIICCTVVLFPCFSSTERYDPSILYIRTFSY